MGKNKHGINEKQLLSSGYKEGTDGIWRKEGGSHNYPTSGSNPKPVKECPLHQDPHVEGLAIPRYIAIVTIRTVRQRDYDGLGASTKYYFDALQHIGLIKDDSPAHLEIVFNPEKCSKFEEEETIIEIWECPQIKK